MIAREISFTVMYFDKPEINRITGNLKRPIIGNHHFAEIEVIGES